MNKNSIAVDASCIGNPGKTEFRGIDLETGQIVFSVGPFFGTNNIGEFLACVHAMYHTNYDIIYTDSVTALAWVKNCKCKSTLLETAESEYAYTLIRQAEILLNSNKINKKVLKWDTKTLGEIPADYNRK